MKAYSEKTKRTIAAVAFIAFAACGINYFAKLGWFGKYDRDVMCAGIILVFIVVVRLGPHPVEEKDQKSSSSE